MSPSSPADDRGRLVAAALEVVRGPELREAIAAAITAADDDGPSSGYVVHTLAAAVHCFVRSGDAPRGGACQVRGARR